MKYNMQRYSPTVTNIKCDVYMALNGSGEYFKASEVLNVIESMQSDIDNLRKRNEKLEQQVLHYITAASEDSTPITASKTLDRQSSCGTQSHGQSEQS